MSEMISDEVLLAKMRGTDSYDYWTLIDVYGNLVQMPPQMEEILKNECWTGLQVKKLDLSKPNKTQTIVVLSSYDQSFEHFV